MLRFYGSKGVHNEVFQVLVKVSAWIFFIFCIKLQLKGTKRGPKWAQNGPKMSFSGINKSQCMDPLWFFV